MKKWFGLIVSVGLLAFSASPAGAVDFNFSGQISGTEPTQTGRIFRADPGSTCDAPTTASLTDNMQQFNYDSFTYTQGATASCVTVTVTQTQCTGDLPHVHVVAYLGSFNPANPLQNHLANIGASPPNTGAPKSFSFNLDAGQTVVIVVSEASTNVACTYNGTISGLTTGALPVTFRFLAAARTSAGVSMRWSTASELELLGFHVYRQVNGKRVRVNRTLIAAKGSGGYTFLDRKAPKGKSVRYWLQVVNLDGSRSWYGPARVSAR